SCRISKTLRLNMRAAFIPELLRFLCFLLAFSFGNCYRLAVFADKLHAAVDILQIVMQLIAIPAMFRRWFSGFLLLTTVFTVSFIFGTKNLLQFALLFLAGINIMQARFSGHIFGILVKFAIAVM